MTLKEMLDHIWNQRGVCHPIHKAKWFVQNNWVWPNYKFMRFNRKGKREGREARTFV